MELSVGSLFPNFAAVEFKKRENFVNCEICKKA